MVAFSFRVAAVYTPILSAVEHLASAAGTPGGGKIGLDVPEGKIDTKADGHTVVVFQINSQCEHRLPP